MNSLTVKFALNMNVVNSIDLPLSGFAIIAVPVAGGMAVVCNSEQTAEEICKFVGCDDGNVRSVNGRPKLMLTLEEGNDYGLSALRKMLGSAGFRVNEVGGIPWRI